MAERKVTALVDCGASVTVISPDFSYALERMAEQGLIQKKDRPYQAGDLRQAFIVVVATDDPKTNEAVASAAKAQGALVNVADAPHLSSFVFPAVVRQGELTLAISTSGLSPALAKRMRLELEESFLPHYKDLLPLLSEVRRELKEKSIQVSPEVWQTCINQDVLELLKAGDFKGAKKKVMSLIAESEGEE